MYRMAVIGCSDSICGFALLGMDIYTVKSSDETEIMLDELLNKNYGIIYITEEFFTDLIESRPELKERRIPVITPIPGVKNNTGIGMLQVKKSVEQAVGSDIL